jgi:chromosome segregation ATPase
MKNKRKLLEQISSKDKLIFELKEEISELKSKMLTEQNTRKTQSMLNGLTEKELKSKINELQNTINEKEEEIIELQMKYNNFKYDSKRLKSKLAYVDIDDEENNIDNGNNANFLNQLKEMQKVYKEREDKLIKEKNEEIKKLRLRNQNLERESFLDNNKNSDTKKYLNEIKRLKNLNSNLEEDLKYYKELNNKHIENDKRKTVYESENVKLQNLIQKKNEEIDEIKLKQKKLEEENRMLERQLINSKGKLGDVLNELAEVESKCVHLEEEKRLMIKNGGNGGN